MALSDSGGGSPGLFNPDAILDTSRMRDIPPEEESARPAYVPFPDNNDGYGAPNWRTFMDDGSIQPFDPGVSSTPPPTSGGYSTNLTAGAAPYGQTPEPTIFVGWDHYRDEVDPSSFNKGGSVKVGDVHRTPIMLTATQLLSAFDHFGRKDYLKFRNLFIAAGLVSESADPQSVRDTYASLLGDIADMTAKGIQMSPMGYIKNLIRMNGLDPSKITAAEDFAPGDAADAAAAAANEPWKKTQVSVYDLSPEDARATLESAMTAKLGRAPTADEMHDFINAAQHAARTHPSKVTATYTPGDTGMEGESSSSRTAGGTTTQVDANGTTVIHQTDGFSAEDVSRMAMNRAKNAPDYAGYQSVSTYFPALLQMLGASTGG